MWCAENCFSQAPKTKVKINELDSIMANYYPLIFIQTYNGKLLKLKPLLTLYIITNVSTFSTNIRNDNQPQPFPAIHLRINSTVQLNKTEERNSNGRRQIPKQTKIRKEKKEKVRDQL